MSGGSTVLVVDDEERIRTMLSLVLESEGVTVTSANDDLTKGTPIEQLVDKIKTGLENGEAQIRPQKSRRLPDVIDEGKDWAIKHWLQRVQEHGELMSVQLSESERRDHVPGLLDEAVAHARGRELASQGRQQAAEQHGTLRYHQGYSAPMLMAEARLLQDVISACVRCNFSVINLSNLVSDQNVRYGFDGVEKFRARFYEPGMAFVRRFEGPDEITLSPTSGRLLSREQKKRFPKSTRSHKALYRFSIGLRKASRFAGLQQRILFSGRRDAFDLAVFFGRLRSPNERRIPDLRVLYKRSSFYKGSFTSLPSDPIQASVSCAICSSLPGPICPFAQILIADAVALRALFATNL